MDEQLRKRLDEAFVKWLNEHRNETTIRNYEDETLAHFSFNACGEWMFKECGGMTVLHDMRRLILAQVKAWLKEHSKTEHYSDGTPYCDTPFATQEDMLDTFDFDMNKLWEEKK